MNNKAINSLRNIPNAMEALEHSKPQAAVPVEPFDPMANPPVWLTDSRFLNPDEELPPEYTWGDLGGLPVINQEGLIVLSAKIKQGKSLALYALLASLISGKPLDTFTPISRPRMAIVFDTEMGKRTIHRRLKAIHSMLGDQRNRFGIIPMKHLTDEEKKTLVEEVIAQYQPDIIAVDVVTNLVEDINSPSDAKSLRNWLQRCANGKTLIAVIHQNKSKDDDSATGHLGSQVMQACDECYNVTRSKGIFTITPKEHREEDCSEATKVNFTLTPERTFVGASQVLEQQTENEAEEFRRDLAPVFGSDKELRHKELCERICKRQGLSEGAARKKISRAAELGAIVNELRGPYRLTGAAADFADVNPGIFGDEYDDDDL